MRMMWILSPEPAITQALPDFMWEPGRLMCMDAAARTYPYTVGAADAVRGRIRRGGPCRGDDGWRAQSTTRFRPKDPY